MTWRAFAPSSGKTVSLSASVSSSAASVAIAGAGRPNTTVRVYNAGAAAVFVEMGDSTVVATLANGMPIPAGGVEVFSIGGATHAAAVTASGATANMVYVTPGEGI